MGEIKQTNFRIDQESADAFRKFCEESGMNQAQGFDHMLQVMELNKAKIAVPGSAKDIESFEMYVKKILEAYLKSVEDYSTARETAKEEYASALASRDKTIVDLQTKITSLQEAKTTAEQAAKTSALAAEQAIKESRTAKEQAETASKLAAEKDKTISTLADKLSVAEEKAAGYDELKKSEETARTQIGDLQKELEQLKKDSARDLKAEQEKAEREKTTMEKDHETQIRELKAEMERKISDVQKDAALTQERAVTEAEKNLREEYQDKLRAADKENAKLQAKIEQLQERIAELTKA